MPANVPIAAATAIPNASRIRLCSASSGTLPVDVRCASLCQTVAGDGRSREGIAPVADSSHHTPSTTPNAATLGQIRRLARLTRDNFVHLPLQLVVDVRDRPGQQGVVQSPRPRDPDPILP